MQGYEGKLEKAIVLTLFIPLIMSLGAIPDRKPHPF
jgi:Mg/Co/Ni transporter MgtE